ncbi:hypothetical protein [Streptomyces sp. NPDC096153]|uniref:hypothetical protein n=1 Tax=Streptomyces sp. NPDC096153 TaxID=3155548 RepID=UPI00331F855F
MTTHLPTIGALTAVTVPDIDREKWTTCYIGRLVVGDVLSLPGGPIRPVVLVEREEENEELGDETYGRVTGTVRNIVTGDTGTFALRANTSVVTRCDLLYVTTPTAPPTAAVPR